VGHSERRAIFKEFDGDINHVVERIQEAGMVPILCVGETKEEYELGLNEEVCTLQLSKDLKGLTKEQVSKLGIGSIQFVHEISTIRTAHQSRLRPRSVIAYEPVWAIGTGLSATPAIAQSVHSAIRKWLRRQYGNEVAEVVRIQYGGSVTADTVDELMKCPDIDGALVGGASLTAKSFARIAMYKA
jgi:triosephosphate isomerase (TIM)